MLVCVKRKYSSFPQILSKTTMAAPHNQQNFLNQKLSLWMLPLVLTMMWHVSVTETAAPIQLRGEVGGNVTIHCPFAQQKTIKFFYFQKGITFVNGYHTEKDMHRVQTWENTRLDPHDKTTVHMYNLNVSHSAEYKCHILYSDDSMTDTVINLCVTANYTKPEVTKSCSDGFRCLVTCVSHGGYPGTSMTWNVPGSEMWKVVNSSEKHDPDTKMVSSSSTAYFNCSSGELRLLSCCVGDVTSDMFTVCTPEDPPRSNTYVIMAVICVFVVLIGVGLPVLYWKCKRKAGAVDVNGCQGEDVALNERKEEDP